jgi:hypothetical protein
MVEHKALDPDDLNRRVKCEDCGETLHAGATSCDKCGSTDIEEDWNSLLSAYSKHDIGEAYFQGRVEQTGMCVEHWGIDKRHQDDHLIFDNKMDLRLWEPQDEQEQTPTWPRDTREQIVEVFDLGIGSVERRWELRGVADVKTKANEDWLGVFNLRHLSHYAEWAAEYDVATFVYMTMVDADAEQVGQQDFFTPITTDWDWETLVAHYDSDSAIDLSYGGLKDTARECNIVGRTFRAPDGNLVIDIEDEERYSWDWFVSEVLAK